jgi:flagellar hook-length control protein FliK
VAPTDAATATSGGPDPAGLKAVARPDRDQVTTPDPVLAANPFAAASIAGQPAAVDPKSGSAVPAPTALSSQIMAQVNQHLIGTRILNDGTHRAVIRLAPDHLGEVTVTLDVRAGNVRMDLIAGPQAISALQADLTELRDQLAQSGLQLGDVSLSQPGLTGGGAGSPDGRERWGGANSPAAAQAQLGAPIEPAGTRPRTATGEGRLDVLI